MAGRASDSAPLDGRAGGEAQPETIRDADTGLPPLARWEKGQAVRGPCPSPGRTAGLRKVRLPCTQGSGKMIGYERCDSGRRTWHSP